jgi:hypothetical protein
VENARPCWGVGFAKDDFCFVGGKQSGGIAVFGRIALSAAASKMYGCVHQYIPCHYQ